MADARRVWDSCTIIDYLAGTERAAPHCQLIIDSAQRGETEIIVSALAEAEVVKLDGNLSNSAEDMIREFFGRPYVLRANVDPFVTETARELIRKYPRANSLDKLRPVDAVHVATAIRWKVPVFESYDDRVLNRINAKPDLLPMKMALRHPQYLGQDRSEDLLQQATEGAGEPFAG